MKDLEILVVSRSEYRTLIYRESPEYTLKSKITNEEILSLDIKLNSDEENSLFNIELPAKIDAGKRMYIDFPVKCPMLVELTECSTVGDVVAQIRDLYNELYENSEEEGVSLDPTVKFDGLFLDNIIICRSGNIVPGIRYDKDRDTR